MIDKDTLARRIRGKRAIDMAAQELAAAADAPLGRIDWQPDPELETPANAADTYLITLATDDRQTHNRLAASLVEQAPDVRDSALRATLEGMIRVLHP